MAKEEKNKLKQEEKDKLKEEENDFVKVKKEELDSLFNKIKNLEKDRDTLFDVADKTRLAKFYEKQSQSLIRQVKVCYSKEEQKYVVGWKMTKNKSEILPHTGKWIEEQNVVVVFEDGSTSNEMPLIEFYRTITINKHPADLIGQTSKYDERSGETINILEVQFPNGKKLLIDSRFIN